MGKRESHDQYEGDSQWCSERIACDLLGISLAALLGFVESGDLNFPMRSKWHGWLYRRKQVMALRKLIGRDNLPPPYWTRSPKWRPVKLHLREIDCAIPSTWWYQARAIADRQTWRTTK